MNSFAQTQDWSKVLKVALAACRQGREVLLSHFGRLEKVEEKYHAGLVSEADKNSEKVIFNYLSERFPSCEYLGEESSFAGAKVGVGRAGPQGRWILDPLDGTTNYVHRFPVFCISLALEVSGDLKIGVIDVPVLQETYVAIKGQGAFVNGKKITVSETSVLNKALLSTGFFPDDTDALDEQLKIFSQLVRESRAIRRPGAAAYDLCQVARGVFDGFWEKNLKPWDVAAGQLIVEEAGGILKTYQGLSHDPYQHSLIAANPLLMPVLQERIKRCIQT
ncbi:MAG: inositol monophosphatase [Bdellovibrionales bacterium]|nr:inositol monophosphatase [Bdellovibrionales bacterium]